MDFWYKKSKLFLWKTMIKRLKKFVFNQDLYSINQCSSNFENSRTFYVNFIDTEGFSSFNHLLYLLVGQFFLGTPVGLIQPCLRIDCDSSLEPLPRGPRSSTLAASLALLSRTSALCHELIDWMTWFSTVTLVSTRHAFAQAVWRLILWPWLHMGSRQPALDSILAAVVWRSGWAYRAGW